MVTKCNTHHRRSKITLEVSASLLAGMLRGLFRSESARPTHLRSESCTASLCIVSVVFTCVGGGGSLQGVCNYCLFLSAILLNHASGKKYNTIKSKFSLLHRDLPFSLSSPPPLFCFSHRFLSLFAFYFPALITSFHFLFSLAFSLFLQLKKISLTSCTQKGLQ